MVDSRHIDKVIILIQAVRLTLGAVLKWTFSKLPTSKVGGRQMRRFPGPGRHRAPKCSRMLNVSFEYPVLEFH